MKTLFVLFLSLFTAGLSFGQAYVDGVAIDTVNTPFCQLICTNATGLTRARILIDHGQHFVDNGLSRQKIADADKRVITFNSSIDALNFMVRHGWELASFKMKGDTFIYLLQRKKDVKNTRSVFSQTLENYYVFRFFFRADGKSTLFRMSR